MEKPVIVIAGATATGKTDAAVAVARALSGEVISADSMQVYRYMDIGTAKPTAEEMKGVPHHMIDVLNPDEECNVALYKKMAGEALADIQYRGRLPVIAGGTGFYINALIKGTTFEDTGASEELRKKYEKLAAERGNAALFEMLEQADPAAAKEIHPNNVKRVVRALEYFEATGSRISAHNQSERCRDMPGNIIFIVLEMERAVLYDRINRRVDQMMAQGLEAEVRRLLAMGYHGSFVSMQAIGYKEIIHACEGGYSLETAVEKIKQGSRRYAKRQITWFKHQAEGLEFNSFTAKKEPERLIKFIENRMKQC